MRSFRRTVCTACIAVIAFFLNFAFLVPAAEAAVKRGAKLAAAKKKPKGKKRLRAAKVVVPPAPYTFSPADELKKAEAPLIPEERELSMEGTAFSLLGRKYRFGGNGANGIDCSAFVRKVFASVNLSLPRTAREQFRLGTSVPAADLKPGDLLFFATYASYASHVGIYLGDGRMVHASSREGKVIVSSTSDRYFSSRFLGAKRVWGFSTSITPLLAELKSEHGEELMPEWGEGKREEFPGAVAAALP